MSEHSEYKRQQIQVHNTLDVNDSCETVRDVIERLVQYPDNAKITIEEHHWYDKYLLYISYYRQETDDEYQNRINALERVKTERKNNAKAQRTLKKQEELEQLKKLAKKYNMTLNEHNK